MRSSPGRSRQAAPPFTHGTALPVLNDDDQEGL
jgi:hypothetical protein